MKFCFCSYGHGIDFCSRSVRHAISEAMYFRKLHSLDTVRVVVHPEASDNGNELFEFNFSAFAHCATTGSGLGDFMDVVDALRDKIKQSGVDCYSGYIHVSKETIGGFGILDKLEGFGGEFCGHRVFLDERIPAGHVFVSSQEILKTIEIVSVGA